MKIKENSLKKKLIKKVFVVKKTTLINNQNPYSSAILFDYNINGRQMDVENNSFPN